RVWRSPRRCPSPRTRFVAGRCAWRAARNGLSAVPGRPTLAARRRSAARAGVVAVVNPQRRAALYNPSSGTPISNHRKSLMCNVPTGRARSFKWAASLSCLVAMALPINQARALNPLGFYVGGAFGQARVDATAPDASGFRENHSAFKVMVGVRPISVVGAEFAYADFGHPSRLNGLVSTDVTIKGASAFGIF